MEETGLSVQVARAFNAWHYKTQKDGSVVHNIVIDFLLACNNSEKVVLNPDEHVDFAWIDGKENLHCSQNTRKVIELALKEL